MSRKDLKGKSITDVLIIGAGAAGLMTAITAKRAGVPAVLLLDSKEKIGAKILMSGGTRCNLTNERVSEKDFQTEQKNILRSVLQFFPSDKAVAFFQGLGIEVVREEGGKFFPATHSGRSVLEALQREIKNQKIELEAGKKVTALSFDKDRFHVSGAGFSYEARCVVLTTGGLSFPATGSNGGGYELAKAFGHKIIETSPSLTPLTSSDPDFKTLSGITLPAKLVLKVQGKSARGGSAFGGKVAEYEGSFLFTHFGFSGPVILNISRHWIREKGDKVLEVNFLDERLPKRLTDVLLKKKIPLRSNFPLPVTGSLGYEKAEVTAGGVDLHEVHRTTLESKLQPGLFFAGEILDVDGRIGGFNFQWAWASGVVAGLGVAAAHP